MELFDINWWAVLVCLPIAMATGMAWYHPKTFFMIWWKGIGKGDEKPGGNMALTWSLTVVSSLVQGAGMGLAVHTVGLALGGVTIPVALATALAVWIAFIAATYIVNKRFAGQGFKVWAIETGNHLLNFLLFALLFAVWR
jgi:hypothetical protein